MDDKLKDIIHQIWNAGYESDISISDEEWIKKIKDITRVCIYCGEPIDVCENCNHYI